MTRLIAFSLLFSVISLAANAPSALADEMPEAIRTLVITGGHGFEEQPFFAAFDAMPGVQVTRATYPAVAKRLTPDLAKDFDVIVFYDMWAKGITKPQQDAFLQLLKRGIGVVALHHTIAAHPEWPEYAKILGAKYYLQDQTVDGKIIPKSTYSHDQNVAVRVADKDHPITQGLGDFKIHDETYAGYDVDPSVRVLLTTEHPKSNREIAWVKTYGSSRVSYIQLGHGPEAYANPGFRRLVAAAIRWSAHRPAPAKSKVVHLFNGKNLTGWKADGNAHWEVKEGLLIGRQGPDNASGDLFTEASFGDFELTVTYKITWPANSGVWYRYQSPEKAYQADILEYKEPIAYSGTLYCPGKMFLAVNDNPQLVNRDGWNTLVILAEGNRHVISLNGKMVGDVQDDGAREGRIGFQIHQGDQFGPMQITVREVRLKPIGVVKEQITESK